MSGHEGRWEPVADAAALRARAEMLAHLRSFFAGRGVLEVETPYLSDAAATDPRITSLAVALDQGGPRWLHTSPEFPMKRLLAAGSGAIYQVCRVFRGGEAGRLHNPEFSLLEWYRPGFDHLELMVEVGDLVRDLLNSESPRSPPSKLTYRQAFQHYVGIDPFRAGNTELAEVLSENGLKTERGAFDRDQCLDWVMGALVGPMLGHNGLCFVTDYPASQAALARIRRGSPDVAERFELYWRGVELANGYHELSDANELAQRFQADNRVRRGAGDRELPADRRLLEALQAGLPDCAGVALGLDRLLMLKLGLQNIDKTLAFSWENA